MVKHQYKKSLGQHFLVNTEIVRAIIDSCGNLSDKNVIEIGPGSCILTKELVKSSKSVLSIEQDQDLLETLAKLKRETSNFHYKITNALKYDGLSAVSYPKVVVANLPYNVGTKIFLNYLYQSDQIEFLILMFQKEVAQRITASLGNNHYGRLSLITQLYADAQIMFDVSPDNFYPPPKVYSSVVKIVPLKTLRLKVDINKFSRVTNLAFTQRRKMISNSLKHLDINFTTIGINPNKRPEELSLEDFCNICNSLA